MYPVDIQQPGLPDNLMPYSPLSVFKSNEWRNSYLNWLESYASRDTQQAYHIAWAIFCRDHSTDITEITSANIINWRNKQLSDGLASATVNQRISAIRAFFKYATNKGLINQNPASEKGLYVSLKQVGDAVSLKKDEHLRLLESINTNTETGKRDYAIILLILSTAVRASVPTSLKVSDLKQQGDAIVMHYTNKGGAKAKVDLPAEVVAAIAKYLECREWTRDSWLFATDTGGQLTYRGLRSAMQRRGKAAGLGDFWLRPHILRHTAARIAEQSKRYTIAQLKDFTKHKNINTLLIYLDSLQQAASEVAAGNAGDIVAGLAERRK